VVTDTQSNIRHLTEIIHAIDNSAEGETEIRVFHMTHANPADVANELSQIFPSNSGNQTQNPFRLGGGNRGNAGGGGGGGGFFARMAAANTAGGAAGSQNARIQKQTQVVAVADARTQSVIVTASKDLMQEIAGMMDQLDVPSTRDQKVFVYHMDNGDPQQTVQVLQNMFGGNTTSSRTGTGSSSQNSALMNRQTQNATTGGTSQNTGTGISGGNTRGAGGGGAAF
jgi:type II secretory pathway component GspD/PulD (secretin)